MVLDIQPISSKLDLQPIESKLDITPIEEQSGDETPWIQKVYRRRVEDARLTGNKEAETDALYKLKAFEEDYKKINVEMSVEDLLIKNDDGRDNVFGAIAAIGETVATPFMAIGNKIAHGYEIATAAGLASADKSISFVENLESGPLSQAIATPQVVPFDDAPKTEIAKNVLSTVGHGIEWITDVAAPKLVRLNNALLPGSGLSEKGLVAADTIAKAAITAVLDLGFIKIAKQQLQPIEGVSYKSLPKTNELVVQERKPPVSTDAEATSLQLQREKLKETAEKTLAEEFVRNKSIESNLDKLPAEVTVNIPFEELKARIVTSTVRSPEVGKVETVYKANDPDLPERFAYDKRLVPVSGNYIPPHFVGVLKSNRVAMWVSNLMNKVRSEAEFAFEKYLFDPEVIQKKGRPVSIPKEDSIMMQLSNLTDREFNIFSKVRKEADRRGSLMGREMYDYEFLAEAKIFGASDLEAANAIRYFKKERDMFKQIAAKDKTSADLHRDLGQPIAELQYRPDYFPRIWDSDFRILIRDGEGRVVHTASANNRLKADAIAKAVKAEYGAKYTAKVENKRSITNDASLEVISRLQRDAKESKHPDSPAVIEFLNKQYPALGMRVHGLARKQEASGYLGDPVTYLDINKRRKTYADALGHYVYGMERTISSRKINYYKNQLTHDSELSQLYPNAVKWSERVMEDFMGRKPFLDQKLAEYALPGIIGESPIPRAITGIRNISSRALLMMFNVPQILLQFTQTISTAAKISGMQQKAGVSTADATAAYLKGFRDVVYKDPTMLDVMRVAEERGAIASSTIRRMFEDETLSGRPMSRKSVWKEPDVHLLSYADEITRVQSMAAFYHFFKKVGLDHNGAIEAAANLTKNYNVDFSMSQTPSAFKGTVGGAVFQMQRWGSNMSAQMLEGLNTAVKDGNANQIAILVAGTALYGGLKGFWGVEEADNIVRYTNSKGWTSKETPSMWIDDNFPEWVAVGPVQSAIDAEIGTANSPTLMRNWLKPSGLSFAVEFVASGINLVTQHVIQGRPDPQDLKRWLLSFAPKTPGLRESIISAVDHGSIRSLGKDEVYLEIDPKTKIAKSEINRESQLRRVWGVKSLEEARLTEVALYIQSMEQGAQTTLQATAKYIAITNMYGYRINLKKFTEEKAQEFRILPSELNTEVKKQTGLLYKSMEHRLLARKKNRFKDRVVDYAHKDEPLELEPIQ